VTRSFSIIMLWSFSAVTILAGNAAAYIGPGSGMEFFGSAMSLLALMGVAFLSIIMWPFYTLMRWIRGSKSPVDVQPEAAADSEKDSPIDPIGQLATASERSLSETNTAETSCSIQSAPQ
jgi:hypothetical protein